MSHRETLLLGLKAGVLTYILIAISRMFIYWSVPVLLNPGSMISYNPLNVIFDQMIYAVIFGTLFAFIHKYIPVSNSIFKSFILGGFIYLLLFNSPLPSFDFQGENMLYLINFISMIASFLIFGIFMGYFYDRFKKN